MAGKRLSPLKSIRAHCLWCECGSYRAVDQCLAHDTCPLWQLRLGKAVKGQQPLKLIRKKCLECVETSREVVVCNGLTLTGPCPIHPYRFGKGRRAQNFQKHEAEEGTRPLRIEVGAWGGG